MASEKTTGSATWPFFTLNRISIPPQGNRLRTVTAQSGDRPRRHSRLRYRTARAAYSSPSGSFVSRSTSGAPYRARNSLSRASSRSFRERPGRASRRFITLEATEATPLVFSFSGSTFRYLESFSMSAERRRVP